MIRGGFDMDVVEALKEKINSNRVTTNGPVLEQQSGDESYHRPRLPEVVVFPENREEVSTVIELAGEYQKSVVPFGVASSLEGSVIPHNTAIVLDFSLMNEILEVKEEDLLVRVQPGVTLSKLNNELKKKGKEHTSELQSRFDIVCRLLLEKKKYSERLNMYREITFTC